MLILVAAPPSLDGVFSIALRSFVVEQGGELEMSVLSTFGKTNGSQPSQHTRSSPPLVPLWNTQWFPPSLIR